MVYWGRDGVIIVRDLWDTNFAVRRRRWLLAGEVCEKSGRAV